MYAYGNPTNNINQKEIDLIDNQSNLKVVKSFELVLPQRKPQSDLPNPPQPFYERYIAHLDSYFCLSVFSNSGSDIDLLHTWLNEPRVDEFWKDSGTREEHVTWLKNRYDDPHVLPVLGSYRFTGGNRSIYEPFAYYEIYWAAEDKVGKFYQAKPYDRGIHMLVGSSNHRGPHRVKSWLPSLIHFIFNDEPQTQRIISEPNHQNSKMIHYLSKFGFEKVNEIDMGHKVAALMILDKDEFWKMCPI
ncbi:hypothetical protein CROQUDRAFT_45504 [Cronartium quercuum f. sp. fusiforme G11]|uniref:Acyltransferase MbtK/IucB-like conserved domain-containing protein n=1 Tax=Cronartium quercuum f. sp. fusiforme G11 TaxID=708437 RepID=A0A9P6NF30_9BASI|nr:hypothetical protein CROQUDRAFT_45504 [Cronartium quercuum f. sp. fusiforme G11]